VGWVPLDSIFTPPFVSSLHTSWVSLTQFLVPLCFLSVHGLDSSWLDSYSLLCAIGPWFPMWKSSACMNILQIWQGLISKIKRSSNILCSNFLFKFFYKQHEIVFQFWWCVF
jgi:hypothetical protein